MRLGRRLVRSRRREERRLLDAGERDFGDDRLELARVGVRARAVDDRVGRSEDAEQRPSPTPVLGRALDQPGDLHELHEHATDPGQRRDRPERRERVVARLDLDLAERLEQRRLADVRRPDERDLRRALAPDGDRVAVDGVRAHAGVVDLRQQRLAEVRVRTVLVVRQLREQRVDLADPVPAFFSYEPSLRHLGEGSMRHRHVDLPLINGDGAARAAFAAAAACVRPAPSSDAGCGRGRSAVLLGDRGGPRVDRTPGEVVVHRGRRVHDRAQRATARCCG